MVQAMRRLWSTAAEFISWSDAKPPKAEPPYPVGDYYADYSELDADSVVDPAANELFRRSKVVSVKR
jgi:hypothetical protein